MNAKKKKLSIIILIIAMVVVAVGGLTTAFLLNYNGFTPEAPTILDDGKNIYITTKLNDSYEKYRFRFVSGGDKFVIDSVKNTITSDEIVAGGGKLGSTYNVSVCYLAQKNGNNSEYSRAISWQCACYLDSPTVVCFEAQKVLEWDTIENADYYRVFVNGEEENYIDVNETSFSYENLTGGQRTFSIVACSNKAGYKTSIPSQSISVLHVRQLKGFLNEPRPSFNLETKIFTAYSTEEYKAVQIVLGSRFIDINSFEVEKEGENYVYRFDIKSIYEGQDLIGILPKSIDDNNVANYDNIVYYRVNTNN